VRFQAVRGLDEGGRARPTACSGEGWAAIEAGVPPPKSGHSGCPMHPGVVTPRDTIPLVFLSLKMTTMKFYSPGHPLTSYALVGPVTLGVAFVDVSHYHPLSQIGGSLKEKTHLELLSGPRVLGYVIRPCHPHPSLCYPSMASYLIVPSTFAPYGARAKGHPKIQLVTSLSC
jgi:hypothetical protein